MSDLTLRETAKILKVSYCTVYKQARTKKLPAYQIGRQWRINAQELDKYRQGKYTDSVSQAAVQKQEDKEWQFSNVVNFITLDSSSKDKAYIEALERARNKKRSS